jgi:hypothetical protein
LDELQRLERAQARFGHFSFAMPTMSFTAMV